MIKKISIKQYKKLSNINFDFSNNVNLISGTNGTCKTSLLHIISNSVKTVTKSCEWINEKSCIDIIKKINSIINPKIESLTRGDKTYNDPAKDTKGALFTVEYFDTDPLEFRKHNSDINSRYSIKPWYRHGRSDKLPYCPVIYLGLSRLFPFGEFTNDDTVKELKKSLPTEYQDEISEIYRELTGISISSLTPQKMGDIKTRADFVSDREGIDSNTISAGEDNLFIIITAIVSLKYYFRSIESTRNSESILLIDEMDATLHPSLQFKILDLFYKYSCEYKIQIFLTTHSISALEYALKKNHNVIYLIDNVTSVKNMDSPDIYKIKMFLHNCTRDDIYISKSIPIFTEDKEARIFLNILFDYFEEKHTEFSMIRRFLHLVNTNIGADNLKNIFTDSYLLNSTMKSICILDGDQRSDYTNYIITLPGGNSPEKMIMEYSIMLYDNDDPFWTDATILELGYGKINYRDNIRPDIDNITDTLNSLRNSGESTHGKERFMNKRVFEKHQRFFELLFKHWVNNNEFSDNVDKFYKDLYTMFKKVAEFHGINPNLWNMD